MQYLRRWNHTDKEPFMQWMRGVYPQETRRRPIKQDHRGMLQKIRSFICKPCRNAKQSRRIYERNAQECHKIQFYRRRRRNTRKTIKCRNRAKYERTGAKPQYIVFTIAKNTKRLYSWSGKKQKNKNSKPCMIYICCTREWERTGNRIRKDPAENTKR